VFRNCVWIVVCAIVLSACSGSVELPPSQPAPAVGLPSLSELARLSSAASDDFLIRQNGADFAPELGRSNVAANGTVADFSPAWTNDSTSLSDAAFCIYRLTFDPADAPITLTLDWGGSAPADYWVALADWTSDRWSWQAMPAGGELSVPSPLRFSDPNQQCYVAVVVLNSTPASLSTIGFGEPPLPTGDGYTLFAPLSSTQTYLIDMAGNVAHEWTAARNPGAAAELLPSGHLLRAGNMNNATFSSAGGSGGRITEFDWDGNVVWSYDLNTATKCTHHDFTVLPNGNILLLVWNAASEAEIVAEGRDPATVAGGALWYDSIIEVQPTLPSGGTIVWEWKAIDHLVQDFDPLQENYDDPGQHPELIDVNYPPQLAGDWTHFNGIKYNAEFDQIVVTTPTFNEFWIIDHTTTTAEAAGHSGGQYGRGGDLLYRWGNPQAYRAGTTSDQKLFFCHNAHWIEDGLVGAGDIMLFNNQVGQPPDTPYSSVVQVTPPMNPDGTYVFSGGKYGPDDYSWEFIATPPESMYSPFVSSAMRLPGGETFINSGAEGHFLQLDAAGNVKWDYQNEFPSPAQATVFRAVRYLPDYPGLANLP
jgi:hypothetical protein